MGADFIMAAIPVEPSREDWQRWGYELEDELVDVYGDFYGGIYNSLADARQWFDGLLDEFDPDSRQVGSFVCDHGTMYYVTGGMSWGDPPTQQYEVFAVLAEIWARKDP